VFAKRLVEAARRIPSALAPDLIVPMPLHRTRQKERGFNQVDLFGRPLARKLGLPYRPVLLKRNRARPEKHLLHFEERWEAVRGTFVIREGDRVDNLQILLLDDVMTSGATLDALYKCVTRSRRQIGGRVDDRPGRAAIPVRESF
jgi:predicted amidophosphoribosyltransferase